MVTLGENGPPEEVPSTPRFDVAYDEASSGTLIGQGGNADVYKITVERQDQAIPLAIKQPRIQQTLTKDVVERFNEETRVWESLDSHDYIVNIVDADDTPIPWIAMEYMDGGSLRSLISEEQLPFSQAVWVGLCVTRAVRHAHRHGVAHHDIKPANVLFRRSETGWMVPKVSDWGLARMMLEETNSVAGLSPQYAAPEQFDADTFGSPDDQTDIYQLGVLLYELFTGKPPFDGTAAAVMQDVLTEQPDPPSSIAQVPAPVDELIMPALEKSKSDRYDSAVYLRDGLEKLHSLKKDGNNRSYQTHSDLTESGRTLEEDPVAEQSFSYDDSEHNELSQEQSNNRQKQSDSDKVAADKSFTSENQRGSSRVSISANKIESLNSNNNLDNSFWHKLWRKPKNNIINKHNSLLSKYFPRPSPKIRPNHKKGITSQLRFVGISTIVIILTGLYMPFLLIGYPTNFVARKFAIVLDRTSTMIITLLTATSWGALTLLTYFQLGLADVLAVGIVSVVAVVAAGLAAVTSKMGGRLTSVLLAHPLAMTALFLPPVVAALVAPSLEPYVLDPSYALAVWILDTVFAVGGLNEAFRGAFDLETFGAGVGLPGIGYLLIWIIISVVSGWLLGISSVVVDAPDQATA